MFDKRKSGILAHPTSFPSPYGIGDLGAGAYEFVDFLIAAKQKLWQVLPLGPTGYGDSPYQSFSSFAGNHYLISPDMLLEQGLLSPDDLTGAAFDARKVDYGPVIEYKMALLKKAHTNFKANSTAADKSKLTKFCKRYSDWLNDYALFTALKDYHDGVPWTSWPKPLAARERKAIAALEDELQDAIEFTKFVQYIFYCQWGKLRTYANDAGITIIGDIPIFVSMDSADIWASPELFALDKSGKPSGVAGVPPDYFSETGQLWGNPLYKWDTHKKTGYAWWCRRVEATLELVDEVRIDHFRGFESYWAVPYDAETAIEGKWQKGPGKALFTALEKKLGQLPVIAEDLGIITPAVESLRTELNLPGMKVLHFAFNPKDASAYLPHMYKDSRTIVYTGTHDNDTTIGWYESTSDAERDYLRRYMNVSGEDIAWDMIRLAFSTSGVYAIIPIQDVMSLDTDDRMNRPGTTDACWQFRYASDMLDSEYAAKLDYLASLFHRNQPIAD